ncbi:hypothetical protein BH10PSE12_BH10PSE12_34850 [soil metagenome]
MAMIGWIISMAALLGGLALKQDMPVMHAQDLANGLLFAAFLSFPPIWSDRPMGITAKPRITLCLAMLLAVPAIMLQP